MNTLEKTFTITTIIIAGIIILAIAFILSIFLIKEITYIHYLFHFIRLYTFVILPICLIIQVICFIIQLINKTKQQTMWIKLLTIIVCGFATFISIILVINPL